MLARSAALIPAMPIRVIVDSLRLGIPPEAGAGAGSMGSALQRLAALRTELHVARGLVPVRTLDRLGRTALPAELEVRRDGLAALHARLAAHDDGRVAAALSAELLRDGVH